MRKKRILFVNEFSQLSTGFATYTKYILPLLHSTGKYEIAELAVYCSPLDPRINEVPWKVYPNEPNPQNADEQQIFNSHHENQFGKWKLEEVLLDFQPDDVWTMSDVWMNGFINKSPLRRHFKLICMPTCDGEPQKDEWIEEYLKYDITTTYSLWAKNVLEKQSQGQIKVVDVTSPGTDINTFKPLVNKNEMKNQLGLKSDIIIFQTVMRNQPRKLFPDLMKAFNLYLDECKKNNREDLAQKSFLHLHTSQPDVGWDLPSEIQKHKLSHKILFTIMCDHCNATYIDFYRGDRCPCRNCKQKTARCPNTSKGVDREILAKVMGIADLYIQYSVCPAKDQEILTRDRGWVKVQDVNTNDYVFTDKGRWKKILGNNEVFNTAGTARELTVDGDYEKFVCSENHKIKGLTKDSFIENWSDGIRSLAGKYLSDNKILPDVSSLEVCKLQKGDLLAYIIDDAVVDIDQMDLSQFTHCESDEQNIWINNYGDIYPRYIDINNNFCKFIGLFVADGSAGKLPLLKITSHINEVNNHNIALVGYQILNNAKHISVRPYPDKNAVDHSFYSTIHNHIFKEWFKQEENKKLPDWTLYLPLEKQKHILQGMFMGDGSYNGRQTIYVTISKILAEQLKHLLRRQRISFNVHIDYRNNSKDNKNRLPQYRFEIYGNIKEGIFNTIRRNTRNFYYNNVHYLKVKSNNIIDYTDPWYNIEVEDDHTYTTKLGLSNNCEGWGMACSDAKACGIPCLIVDYSAMSEQATDGAWPIKIERFCQEPQNQTNQLRAFPDNQDCANKMFKYITLSNDEQSKMKLEARKCVEDNYSWPSVSKKWEKIFDSLPENDLNKTWLSPPKLKDPQLVIPNNLSNDQFIQFCYEKIKQEPEEANSITAKKMVSLLNIGYESAADGQGRPTQIAVNREMVLNSILNWVSYYNYMETLRYNKLVLKEVGQNKGIGCVEV